MRPKTETKKQKVYIVIPSLKPSPGIRGKCCLVSSRKVEKLCIPIYQYPGTIEKKCIYVEWRGKKSNLFNVECVGVAFHSPEAEARV